MKINLIWKLLTGASFFIVCALGEVQAQHICPTQLSEDQINWLKKKQLNREAKSAVDEPLCLPVLFHVLGTDDGENYLKFNTILESMCFSNEAFGEFGIQFYLYDGGVRYINSSRYYGLDYYSEDSFVMMNTYNEPDVINVYIVGTIVADLGAGGGVIAGFFSPGADALCVRKASMGFGEQTLNHEFGHYFNLPHPFNGWEGGQPSNSFIERVARTGETANCYEAGDFFCDTNADYLSDPWSCSYNGDLADPDGVVIDPDPTLIMSYSNSSCKTRFSFEQISIIRDNILERRQNLMTDPSTLDHTRITQEIDQVYPANGTAALKAGSILFQWTPISGEVVYHLNIYTLGTNRRQYDFFTNSNSQTVDLESSDSYHWTVTAYSDLDYCLGYSGIQNFETKAEGEDGLAIAGIIAQQPSCIDSLGGSIELIVEGGETPYEFNWLDLEGVEETLAENIAAGTYQIEVRDQSGLVDTFGVRLNETVDLEVGSIVTRDGLTSIEVEAGTPPFIANWENDEGFELQAGNLPTGPNSAEVVDGNGCTVEMNINILEINYALIAPACNGEDNGQIIVFEPIGGQAPYTFEWVGLLETSSILTGVGSGAYTLKVTDSLKNVAYFTIPLQNELPVVEVENNEGIANVIITGGTPPYEISWSSGETGETATELENGTNTVSVTDNGGCTTVYEFEFEAITSVNDFSASIELSPNPIEAGQWLQINVKEKIDRIEFRDMSGREIEFTVEQNGFSIPKVLSDGLYFLNVHTEGGLVTKKLIIF